MLRLLSYDVISEKGRIETIRVIASVLTIFNECPFLDRSATRMLRLTVYHRVQAPM